MRDLRTDVGRAAALGGCRSDSSLCNETGSTLLEHGLHLPYWPAFAGRYYAHPSTLAYQRMRTHLVVDGDDREVRLRLPVQGEVEVTQEDLPLRTVVQFDEVALGMGSDLHRISLRAAEYAGFPERRSPAPSRRNRPPS